MPRYREMEKNTTSRTYKCCLNLLLDTFYNMIDFIAHIFFNIWRKECQAFVFKRVFNTFITNNDLYKVAVKF